MSCGRSQRVKEVDRTDWAAPKSCANFEKGIDVERKDKVLKPLTTVEIGGSQ